MKHLLKRHLCLALLVGPLTAFGQHKERIIEPKQEKEGEGPYTQLILRNVTLIDGTLAPPIGPVDIVIEGSRIKSIHLPGAVGSSAYSYDTPQLKAGGREIGGKGLYVMPGLIDTHQHIGNRPEHEFKLDLAHGITTIRDPGSGDGLINVLKLKHDSEQNLITAPKIKAYLRFGFYPDGTFNLPHTPEDARAWVRMAAKAGADGVKDAGFSPDVIRASLDEDHKLGLQTMIHHRQTMVARWNALDSAKAGVGSMEHWYGLPEALFTDRTVEDFPANFNYQDEQNRFGEGGKLWSQAAPAYSDKWNAVMNEMLANHFTLSPTFTVYEKFRDYMRARTLEWYQDYAYPEDYARSFNPSTKVHGASLHNWTSKNEADWRKQFQLWMTYVNEYKNRGGRVSTGSDDGMLFGFSLIRELELLEEAGFMPLEALRSGTLSGAELLRIDHDTGSVEIGKLADLIIIDQNPLENFKVLYGTGSVKMLDNGDVVRVGGVKYTVKEGVIYDAKKLLAEVKGMVDADKAKTGGKIVRPGYKE